MKTAFFFEKLFFPHSIVVSSLRVTVVCTASGQKTFSFIYFFEDRFCFGVRRAFIWFGLELPPRKTKGFIIKNNYIFYYVPAK